MPNPFRQEALQPDALFCNRVGEQRRLKDAAESGQNVLLHSPRRYGKTSLCRKVQHTLNDAGYACVFVDFFGVDGVEEIARRLARAVAVAIHSRQPLWDKGRRWLSAWKSFRLVLLPASDGSFDIGVEKARLSADPRTLLDDMLQDLAEFVRGGHYPCHVVFDEFQEITRLREAALVEGLIRGAIQGLECSFVFAGSRRGILKAMFQDRTRPFFQSATPMELPPLPTADAVAYLREQFARGGREISEDAAGMIVDKASNHPYYIQHVASDAYAVSEEVVGPEEIEQAYELTTNACVPLFEATLTGLTPQQIGVLRSVAQHQPTELSGKGFSQATGLQPSSIAYSRKKLLEEDLIERRMDRWRVVDPVFEDWLRRQAPDIH
ncbi:ATP-binding protein [Oceanidesulfovibrio indonesiensis]|uniref:ATP-binding protein n=1 Tax=Oceanidesulfovibrio indonesiensis TaxID=54767 RepID=A0A7M3MIM2_9BACT|nr:ATP-binding protein [Oceanidesulfovibrio indonesiensis]TVM19250.1 ATP-binding protein [Oceanidesulfovibrio indonesiensis]